MITEETQTAFAKAMMPYLNIRTKAHEKKLEIVRANRKVYFIIDEGLVKVGFSEFPFARLDQIKTSRPSAFLLGEVKGGTKLEKEIHNRLSKWHFDREWFYYSEEVRNIIKEYLS